MLNSTYMIIFIIFMNGLLIISITFAFYSTSIIII